MLFKRHSPEQKINVPDRRGSGIGFVAGAVGVLLALHFFGTDGDEKKMSDPKVETQVAYVEVDVKTCFLEAVTLNSASFLLTENVVDLPGGIFDYDKSQTFTGLATGGAELCVKGILMQSVNNEPNGASSRVPVRFSFDRGDIFFNRPMVDATQLGQTKLRIKNGRIVEVNGKAVPDDQQIAVITEDGEVTLKGFQINDEDAPGTDLLEFLTFGQGLFDKAGEVTVGLLQVAAGNPECILAGVGAAGESRGQKLDNLINQAVAADAGLEADPKKIIALDPHGVYPDQIPDDRGRTFSEAVKDYMDELNRIDIEPPKKVEFECAPLSDNGGQSGSPVKSSLDGEEMGDA